MYTQKRNLQWRGPSTTDDYNARIEENYKDLTVLMNRARISDVEINELFRRLAKDQYELSRIISDLEERVKTVEDAGTRFTFYSSNQVATEDFAGLTPDPLQIAVTETERLEFDQVHGVMTLPQVEEASISKLFFTNEDGREVIPPGFEYRIVGDNSTADNPTSFIDSSPLENALYRQAGLVWERNVVADASDADGAEMTVYIKTPADLFTTEKSNSLLLHPFPSFGITVKEIAYSTKVDPIMDESDVYTVFNSSAHYDGEQDAVGWVVPGGWSGDELTDVGPKKFFFSPKTITAIRLKIHQDRYFRESGKYVYTYGLSQLDLRYDKFAKEGRAILRFDAPDGQTISSIDEVTPEIWNVSPASISDVFSYRVIWETAENSGIYTDSPVANSSKVWIEITLKGTDGWTPALSGLNVSYT